MAGMESVLNRDGVRFVEMIDDLGLERLDTRYTFSGEEEYKELLRHNVNEGMRVYWTETLQRVHLAAATAILRSRRWLSGVVHAAAENNFLVFSASLRGLMESAADSSTALLGTPLTLAQFHSSIAECLAGQATTVFISSELENELIHYSHARHLRRSERANAPSSHQARRVQEYLNNFGDQNADNVRQCYGDLCDLAHPGASSVWMWLASEDLNDSAFRLSTHQDEALIAGFLRQYATMPLELLMFAFNGPLIALNILNYFAIEDLHTPQLLTWHLDGIPAWTKCRDELGNRGIRPVAATR